MRYLAIGSLASAIILCAGETPSYNPDPLSKANGQNVLFIDQDSNPDSDCSDTYSRQMALDPATPWCSLAGIDESASNRLGVGDTVYIRGGEYLHWVDKDASYANDTETIPIVNVVTDNVTLTSYPGEEVILRAGSYDSTWFLIVAANNVTIHSLTFQGNIPVPAHPELDITRKYPSICSPPCISDLFKWGPYCVEEDLVLYMPRPIVFQGVPDNHVIGVTVRDVTIKDFQGFNDAGFCYRDEQRGGQGLRLRNVTGGEISNSKIGCMDEFNVSHQEAPFYRMDIVWLAGDGLSLLDVNSVRVHLNQFYDCGHVSLGGAGGSNNIIEHNEIVNRVHKALSMGGTDLIIRNNLIHDWNQRPSFLGGGYGLQLCCGVSNAQVYNNILYHGGNKTGDGIVMIGNGDGNSNLAHHNKIFNNLVYNAGLAGIRIVDGSTLGTRGVFDNEVYNNILFGTRLGGYAAPLVLDFPEESFDDFVRHEYRNVFKNNLLLEFDKDSPVITYEVSNSGYDIVSISKLNSLSIGEANIGSNTEISKEDLFVDANAFNFRPKKGSLVSDKGICTGQPYPHDYDDQIRPASCDIGPFEIPVSEARSWVLKIIALMIIAMLARQRLRREARNE